jgi:regulator of RNase E activity RraA
LKTFKIQQYATGGMISDIIDEENIENAQRKNNQFIPTLDNTKICGRIKTVTLREGNEPSISVDDIFNSTMAGDVLVIEGSMKWAYWGRIMSSFAKMKCLAGTVILGCSRDKADIAELDYPVYAKDFFGVDIKNRGYVAEIGSIINFEGITYRPNDYLFIDQELLTTLPANSIDLIYNKVNKLKLKEDELVFKIFQERDVNLLVKEHNL